LSLQSEIALQIAETLALNLTGNERNVLTKRYTESPDAYHLYVKARNEWNKRSYPGIIEAQRLFRNAIERDPNFALAYVGLADTIATGTNSTEATMAIEKALEIDPNLGEAHASLGFLKMFHGRQWPEAEKAFKHAVELNPNYATARHWYATLLAIKGETASAKTEMRRALEINPLSHNFLADLGQIYYFSGEYVEAKEYCNKALEIYPDFVFAHQYLHYIYLKTGEYDRAIEEIIKTDKLNSAFSNAPAKEKERLEARLDGYRQGGIKGYMERRFPGTPQDPGSFYFYAIKHAFLGEKDKALDYLEKANAARTFCPLS
jgi:tetratricopeptide (TPR) repeat protein